MTTPGCTKDCPICYGAAFICNFGLHGISPENPWVACRGHPDCKMNRRPCPEGQVRALKVELAKEREEKETAIAAQSKLQKAWEDEEDRADVAEAELAAERDVADTAMEQHRAMTAEVARLREALDDYIGQHHEMASRGECRCDLCKKYVPLQVHLYREVRAVLKEAK